jgi:branched-chain amino acid aminotransferase
MDGEWVAWDEAKIHILSHVIHYGSSVFEGTRCYQQPGGPAIFRLEDHTKRLYESARIYRMDVEYPYDELIRVQKEIVTRNRLGSCYLRPLVYRAYNDLGVNPFGKPVQVAVAAFPWGDYLGPDQREKGVAACVSSWRRPAPDTYPSWAKAGGHYTNSQLIKMEAVVNGYVEGIGLDYSGNVSEGSGMNLFAVRKGVLYTPPIASSILVGITRDSVLQLARDLEIVVREEEIPRDMLYVAEELFFVGTAVEISPVTSIDRIDVGDGKRGPITKMLQDEFFGILEGAKPDRHGWLTPVGSANSESTSGAAASTPAARG